MIDNNRYRRLRLLVHKVNKARKQQAKQIDILCHDLIEAQRDFNRRLSVIGLSASFYQSILGVTDLEALLNIASAHMVETTDVTQVVFVIRSGNQCKTHACPESTFPTNPEVRLEELFSQEVLDGICHSGRACTMADMLAMGLQIRPTDLSRVSASTIPLTDGVCSRGFMLLYHKVDSPISPMQIEQITAITGGLTKAITACEMLSRSA